MGWILGLVAIAAALMMGVASFACVAVYKASGCQLD